MAGPLAAALAKLSGFFLTVWRREWKVELTEADIEEAFMIWLHSYYGHVQTMREIRPLEEIVPTTGWLAKIRRAKFLSVNQVAARLMIARTTYSEIERAEVEASITIATLKRCAEALECDFIYGLRPKNSPAQQIWRILLEEVKHRPNIRTPVAKHRSQRLAAFARNKMYDPQFRKKQNWSRNTEGESQEQAKICKILRRER